MNNKEILILSNIPESIETDKLIIRRYLEGDGAAIYALTERNDNRNHLKGIADDIANLKSIQEAELKARKHRGEWVNRDRFVAGIWLKKDGLYVGELWIEPVNWDVSSFEIGWFIDKGCEGRGMAYEAAVNALVYLFDILGAHKVIASMDDTNSRSYNLAERLGFKKEGHFIESEIRDHVRFGKYYFGLLKSEFDRPPNN